MPSKSNGWKVTLTVLAVAIALLGLVWGVTDKKIDDRCGANASRLELIEDEQIVTRATTTKILQAVERIETSQEYTERTIQEIKEELRDR